MKGPVLQRGKDSTFCLVIAGCLLKHCHVISVSPKVSYYKGKSLCHIDVTIQSQKENSMKQWDKHKFPWDLFRPVCLREKEYLKNIGNRWTKIRDPFGLKPFVIVSVKFRMYFMKDEDSENLRNETQYFSSIFLFLLDTDILSFLDNDSFIFYLELVI